MTSLRPSPPPLRLAPAVRQPRMQVGIYCKGEQTTATETLPGKFRCDRCGDVVKVAW